MDNVSIILINFNGNNDTLECIESIKKSDYKNLNIIVVDNCSIYDNYLELKKNLEGDTSVTLIRSDINLGFAGGNNLGIEYALKNFNSQYILLLNNDTLICKNTISELVSTAKNNEDCGIVGGKIYYYPESTKIWYAGGNFDWTKFTSSHNGMGKIDDGSYEELKKTEFITGCVMLIKREVIDKVGLLPEEYFMYYEDNDYCVTVQEKGYSLYYNPKAIIYHKISASSGGEESPFSIEYSTRNRRYFMKKFKYKIGTLRYINSTIFFYVTRFIKIILYSLKGEHKKSIALFNGLKQKVK